MTKLDMIKSDPPEKLVRVLLKRLQREAKFVATEKAIEAGVLYAEVRKIGRHRVIAIKPGVLATSSDEAGIRRTLETARRMVGHQSIRYDLDTDGITMSFEDAVPSAVTQEKSYGMPVTADQVSRFRVRELMQFVAESADPPRATDVATLLLLADAVDRHPTGYAGIAEVLRLSRPIVVVSCLVRGFENAVLSLMKRGLVTLGEITKTDGYRDWGNEAPHFDYISAPRNKVVCFAGQNFSLSQLEDRIADAANSPYPILAVAEELENISQALLDTAELHLECGLLTAAIVRKTIETVLGEPPLFELDDADCSLLSLGQLELAIRPGVWATRAIEILVEFALQKKKAAEGATVQDTPRDNCAGRSRTVTRWNDKKSTGSEIIQPVGPDDVQENKSVPFIETLSGYGEARTWAMDLKEDLALWRSGDTEWSDMSTKLLLSGPPGTGKTYFARALCNSLKIPLVATSVAIWLESNYLGEVLQRMSNTFKEATTHSPCIVFVDEIDGIGNRFGERRQHTDYWNTLVNRALELFDGVKKTEGVIIVAATNLPSAIDPALLRSGRLETHIPIQLPDIDALCGVIRHQLGEDLAHIVPGGLEALRMPDVQVTPSRGGASLGSDI